MGFDALEDVHTMVGLLQEVVIERKPGLLDDADTCEELERVVGRMKARQPFLEAGFSLREVNLRFRKDEHRQLMHQWY